MPEAERSSVARAVENLVAYLRGLRPASSSTADPSSTTDCHFEKIQQTPDLPSTTDCNFEKIQEDIKRLLRMLGSIRATLDKAESMEFAETAVSARRWLRELEEVAYATEDVLDEFPYEAMRLGLMEDGGFAPGLQWEDAIVVVVHKMEKTRLQVRRLPSSPSLMHQIAAFLGHFDQRMGSINTSFDDIMKHNLALSFQESHGQVPAEMTARQPTSSLIHELAIFGREKDLEMVRRFLLSDAESSRCNSVPIMAIVGMGGLGKTTLAQLAYNDGEIDKHFQVKSWVCVSENFDLVRLTKAMTESFNQQACNISVLDPLQVNLKRRLVGQRFLLVVDDVWEAEDLSVSWDQFVTPLHSGSAGSKIILTTRSEKVSRMVGAISTYRLPCLKDGDCLKLFNRRAFDGRDPDLYQNLMAIGTKISKRCKGLPLVAKTLGGLLRCEDNEQMWNHILDSNVWDMSEEKKIMDVLRLSYQHLPPHLKRCFRYCSVFPKDHEFDLNRLVLMWMAHGYIQTRGRKLVEDIGKEYFTELLGRSFFQYSQKPQVFVMHDLIHDLARCVSGDECCSVQVEMNCLLPRQVRHFSIVSDGDLQWSITSSGNFSELETLRSFLFIAPLIRLAYPLMLSDDFFTRMKSLRLLDLRYAGISELPDSIGCMKHLRHLGLRGNPIEQLPESVGRLFHLKTLDLKFCNLAYLPSSIPSLFNLRHLFYKGVKADPLTVWAFMDSIKYPVGIGNLVNLQTMPGFLVSQDCDCAKLGELKDMNSIRSLRIEGVNNLVDVEEARKACLENKEHLWSLELIWEDSTIVPPWLPSPIDDDLLGSFRPNSKLKRLSICNFNGQSLPSWLGHPSFSQLTKIELHECKNWASLPPLGQLPSLIYLSIQAAKCVKYIGHEFFFGGFPRLRTLKLKHMGSWESWHGAEKGECPHLRELIIADCVNLVSLSMVNLDALEILKISECDRLRFSSEEQLPSALQVFGIDGCHSLSKWCQYHRQRLVHIQQLEIQGMDNHHVVLHNVWSVEEAKDVTLKFLQKVQHLELAWYCDPNLISSTKADPDEVLENLQPSTSLNKLVIRGYNGSMFASWLGDPSFSNLVSVTLNGCTQCELLPPLGSLPLLTKLHINGAHRLTCIGKEFEGSAGFPYLERLEFNDMPNWEEWVAMEGHLSYLCELIIKHCPMLRELPRLPPSLVELEIEDCNAITFPSPFTHLTSLRTLRISQVPNLQNLPDFPIGLTKLSLRCLPALADLVTPPSVRYLELKSCNEALVAACLPHVTHLTSLEIIDFQNLTSFPLHNQAILRDLQVSTCPRLMNIDCFHFSPALLEYVEGLQALKSLEHLSISDCPMLHFHANERPPSTLQSIDISNSPLVAAWRDKIWEKRKHTLDDS